MTRARDSRWSPNGRDAVHGSGRIPTSGGAEGNRHELSVIGLLIGLAVMG